MANPRSSLSHIRLQPSPHTVAGIDFIGIDDKRQRLLHVESAADCDAGVSSISQSLLQTYPHLQALSEP